MLLITILLFSLPPRGSPPSLWPKYESSIDLTKGTFKCFDGSKIINISHFNDNYPDCDDFSDEPGTPINTGTKFFCPNEGWEPKLIDKWEVDDGICDCCDCSDESPEISSKNKETCSVLKARKEKLESNLHKVFSEGFEKYKVYLAEGEESYKKKIYEKSKLDYKINILEQMRQRVIDKQPYDDLNDPDDFIPFDEFIPPPNNPEENENKDDYIGNYEETLNEYSENNNNEYGENTVNEYGEIGDDDDEYRYERYYDSYRYGHYYNPEEFYRNDYTYDYVSNQDEPPTPEVEEYQENQQQNGLNDFTLPAEESDNSNAETEIEEESSWFRRFFEKIWKITFLFPDSDALFHFGRDDDNSESSSYDYNYNDYDYGYHPYDRETTAKLDAIDNQLNPARTDSYNYNQLTKISPSIDKAYFKLFRNSFSHQQFSFTFLDDFKMDYEYLGTFQGLNESSHIMSFTEGSVCNSPDGSSSMSASMKFYCWNSDRLARVIRQGECRFLGVFLSPAACRDFEGKLKNMTLEEMEELNDIANI